MNTNYKKNFRFALYYLCLPAIFLLCNCQENINDATIADKKAVIFPDYDSAVIPSNIAPLNFIIKQNGDKYHVIIKSLNGQLVIQQNSPVIKINERKWKNLLAQSQDKDILISIFVKERNKWLKYNDLSLHVSKDKIDPYIVYRLVDAVYLFWYKMGIYQRNLESFEETALFKNEEGENDCVNCHSFANNDPSKMLLHFRIINGGTMINNNGTLTKINTKTPYTMSAGVYPSRSPDGQHIAFSVGKLSPKLTSRPGKILDVPDVASDIIVLDLRTNTVTTSPLISTKNRENLPTWSPDGKTIYYISAPKGSRRNLDSLLRVKYSLCKIDFEPETNKFGTVDTILSSSKTGISISFPSISPDGRYIVFSGADYGYFTIYNAGSDLYLLDLKTKEYKKLPINSNTTESYHSWSKNGRWIMFISKRLDGIYSRPFFSYFDEQGQAHKPFLMPLKNPRNYEFQLTNYNRPEFITGPVKLSKSQFRDIANSKAIDVNFDSSIEIDALSGATHITK